MLVVVLACGAAVPDAAVRPGIDVLLRDSAHLVAGRRVGLLANAASVDRNGVSDLGRLLAAGVEVTAIFSPEHGYRVRLEGSVPDAVDSATGLPVFGLYGASSRPTAAALDLIDVLLVDLPDIGGRTYTYASTMFDAMEAAGASGIAVVVLDRPNPIGGQLVQGPTLHSRYASEVGRLPIPMRHGMTLGELARLGAAELGIDADVSVVPVAGWTRGMWFDGTGMTWANPSPSMPSLESATHYPGLVIFEATRLSVGRGTPIAFQLVAAPWLDPAAVLGEVSASGGVEWSDTTVVPQSPPDNKYGGELLPAIRLRAIDRDRYDPVATGVALFLAIGRVHPDRMQPDSAGMTRLWGSPALWNAWHDGVPAGEVVAGWQDDLAAFRARREAFVLYR
jgi:uncharacterized protein YbbC (DUF1343 family)